VTTALPLSSSYSPFAAVKVVLPKGSFHLDRLAHAASTLRRARGRSSLAFDYKFHFTVLMSRENDYEAELAHQLDTEIDTNLASLEYSLKLCRDHRTYVSLETLASAIHRVLQDETEALVKHLSTYATGKRE
jgi:hypothetical protein